jgi:hypothetical protein
MASLQDEILADFQRTESDYKKLVEFYATQMKATIDKHGGNISDVPAQADHPYWKLQNKLTAAHHMNNDGLLPKPVPKVEPVVEEKPIVVDDKPIDVSDDPFAQFRNEVDGKPRTDKPTVN